MSKFSKTTFLSLFTAWLFQPVSAQSIFSTHDLVIEQDENSVELDEIDESISTERDVATLKLDRHAFRGQLQRLGWRDYDMVMPDGPPSIALANGETINFNNESIVSLGEDQAVLIGTADGETEPSMIFLSGDKIIDGTVHLNGTTFDLSASYLMPVIASPDSTNGQAIISLVEQSHWEFVDELPALDPQYPPDEFAPATLTDFSAAGGNAAGGLADIQMDETDVPDGEPVLIDIAVFWTPGMRQQIYNRRVRKQIEALVARTNFTFSNSGMNHQLRLVHAGQVDYTPEGDMVQDLRRVANGEDGYMDDIIESWKSSGADIVSLWVDHGNGAGVAFVMNEDSVKHAPCAISVVRWPELRRNYSFAHEIGHTMGARHDRMQDEKETPYPFAHGYVNDLLVTIMAYPRKSCAEGAICERVPMFSNTPSDFGEANLADVSRTFEKTSKTVARFSENHDALGTCNL